MRRLLICHHCAAVSAEELWRDGEIFGCEMCGEHAGLWCPVCSMATDLAYGEPEEWRPGMKLRQNANWRWTAEPSV